MAAFVGALTLNAAVIGGLALREVRTAAPAPSAHPAIYARLEPWPVTRRTEAAPALDRSSESDPETALDDPDDDAILGVTAPSSRPNTQPPLSGDGIGDAWRVRPPSPEDRLSQALRGSALGCANRQVLNAAERDRCDQRLASTAAGPITGTGDAERDARFARQGARQLAEYEARRAAPPARTPCDKGGPIADCGAEINVEIFSSIDGFFPNLRNDD